MLVPTLWPCPTRLGEDIRVISIQVVEVPQQAAFRVSEAARYLGISPNTLRKRSDLGLILVRRDENGERIFLLRDLNAYLESLPTYRRRDKPVSVSTDWNRPLVRKESR
jgi:hypothetical protein